MNNALTVQKVIQDPLDNLRHFLGVKTEVVAEDARRIGQLLLLETSSVHRSERALEKKLGEIIEATEILRSVQDAFPWFKVLLLEVLRNRVQRPHGSKRALADFTEDDARKAGRAFANALIANVTAVAAVDEWAMTYPTLGQLEQR
ncbi:hypothetical protein TeGR_g8881 [Tetraparma gracilis]|uniref:Uncharacterized protein n=1 Tax=Tetraparma gracilis TaxID=2962635 RepID=A0ABQ6M5K2_9STRA|nr:hypothetical protein TeGR_g8881 [Tetraparma gracilis]